MTTLFAHLLSHSMALRDNFHRTLSTKLQRSVLAVLCIVCIFVFVVLATLAPRGLQNGDAALYAQQIEAVSLEKRTVHVGYYLLCIAFTHLTPLDMDFALNILNVLLGALCAAIVFSITYTINGRPITSFAAPIVLLTHYVFVNNAIFAEVYVPQLFFFLLSVQLTLWNRSIGAGLSFAFAFLVTPSTILSAPFILLLRPQKRFVLLWAITLVAVVTIAISFHINDFLYGERGLLMAMESRMSIKQALMKEFQELMGFSFIAVFIMGGLISMGASIKHRLFAISIVCLWLAQLVFGERFGDVPVQLPLYSIFAVVAAVGLDKILHHQKRPLFLATGAIIVFALGIVFSGAKSYSMALQTSRSINYYRDTVYNISQIAEPGFIAIGPWSQGILMEHYLFRKSYTGSWINTEWLDGKWSDKYKNKSWEQFRTAMSEGNQVWLLQTKREDINKLLLENGYKIKLFRDVSMAKKAFHSD